MCLRSKNDTSDGENDVEKLELLLDKALIKSLECILTAKTSRQTLSSKLCSKHLIADLNYLITLHDEKEKKAAELNTSKFALFT
ncbi:hypothetical protein BpHYR1_007757 [Brachionus plicatilis]|uniref:Uncharacterized protein n=1 Tax=Brachionus plicatilis TaxID=10195 RepID=A0A3M7RP98_BRAPC|nr:hypothetical protein BpHYR1_007757 [Brachionus plicatilis]